MAAMFRILAVLILVISTHLSVRAESGSPALWRVQKDDAVVYLFGTIHLLPPHTQWQSAAIKNAIEKSQSLTLEIEDPTAAGPEVSQYVAEHGFLRDGRTLADIVGEDKFMRVSEVAQGLGLPPQAIMGMRPWLASVALTLQFVQTSGFASDSGAEMWLSKVFEQLGRPIHGLETPLDSVASLAGLSDAVQGVMLVDTVEQLADETLQQMHNAWLSGDLQALEALVLEPLAEQQEVYQAILVDRNMNWVPQIRALLDTDGAHFVAVGAGHLIGDDSVIRLLETQGLKVERVDAP